MFKQALKITIMAKSIVPFLLPLLLMLSCVSAEKALDKGDHKDAVWKALSKLKKKPDDGKSRKILKAAYPLFLEDYKREIADLKQKRDPFKWEKIQEKYETMEAAYTKIRAINTARKAVDAQTYSREIYDAKEKVLEARYNVGMDLLADGDRKSAKKAYDHFEFILERQDIYKDTNLRLEEAREMATLFVGIAPIQVPSFRYELNVIDFERELVAELQRSNNEEFVQFIGPSNRYNIPLEEVDHVIEMRLYDFIMGNTQDREQVFTRSKDNVATQVVTVGDSTFTTPIIVEAEVHCFTREITSSGRMELEIIDSSNGRREERERFDGGHRYTAEWGYFTGDTRALDNGDTNCLNQRNPPPQPRAEELFTEVTIPIYDQTLDFLERYYRNY